jgi:hypothetical protein
MLVLFLKLKVFISTFIIIDSFWSYFSFDGGRRQYIRKANKKKNKKKNGGTGWKLQSQTHDFLLIKVGRNMVLLCIDGASIHI